jgi:hypothetical protein
VIAPNVHSQQRQRAALAVHWAGDLTHAPRPYPPVEALRVRVGLDPKDFGTGSREATKDFVFAFLWTAASCGRVDEVRANPRRLFMEISTPRSSLRLMSAHPVSWYVFLVEASGARRDCAPRRSEWRSEGKVSTEMIRVTVEINEGALTYKVRVTAPSIERALEIMGDGKPGRRVRLLFPIDPEAYFVPEDVGRREEAA